MRALNRFGLCLAVLVLSYVQTSAKEIVYTNLNCAVTYPSGWQHFPTTGTNYIALVKDFADVRAIVVEVGAANPKRPVVDERFKQEARAAFGKGMEITSERFVTMGGVPALETTGNVRLGESVVSSVVRIAVAGNRAYKINTMFKEGNASTDTNLQACLNSFRFLNPPPAPGSAGFTPVLVFLVVLCGGLALCGRWLIRWVRHVQSGNAGVQR